MDDKQVKFGWKAYRNGVELSGVEAEEVDAKCFPYQVIGKDGVVIHCMYPPEEGGMEFGGQK